MEKKELIIIIICLIIPLIVFSFFGLNFIVTILLSLIVGSGGLLLANQSKNAAKVFAAASTLGVFYALGYTVYWFLNFIILAVIMYFYTSSSNIEDALLKIIVLTTTIGLLGYWRYTKPKEGFYVSPLKNMGGALTAKNCQDLCEANVGCRYAQVPVGTSKTGGSYKCEIGYGFNQSTPSGNVNQGGDTWLKKGWKPPITVSGSGSNIQTSGSRNQTVSIGKKYTNMIPKEITISAALRDQGWGNPTWGIYLVGNEVGSGKVVFLEKLQAPRTSRKERYPIYKRVSYRTTITKRKLAYDRPTYYYKDWWHRLWRKKSVAYYGYWKAYSVPVTKYKNVLQSYGTRTVQGSPSWRSITKQVNPSNKKISSVYCYVNTTGSGHSLKMNNVNWSVRGWSV